MEGARIFFGAARVVGSWKGDAVFWVMVVLAGVEYAGIAGAWMMYGMGVWWRITKVLLRCKVRSHL